MHFTVSVFGLTTKLSTLTYYNSITFAQRTLLFNKSTYLFILRLQYTKNFYITKQVASAIKYFYTTIFILLLYILYLFYYLSILLKLSVVIKQLLIYYYYLNIKIFLLIYNNFLY